MKHTRKKITSSLLVLSLSMIGVPANISNNTVANAAWAGKSAANTSISTADIQAPKTSNNSTPWKGNYVYYGKYNDTSVKYRVLAPSTDVYGGNTMLLDCDTTLYNAIFHISSNIWATSSLKNGLNGNDFLNKKGVFTEIEKNSIAESTKSEKSSTDGTGHGSLSWTALTGEKIFLLDAKEATNPSYGYMNINREDATKTKSGTSSSLWLRSPVSTEKKYIGCITKIGSLSNCLVNNAECGVSPAFNVDLNSVLFSSVVSSTTSTYDKEYKLTLKDDDFNIAVTEGSFVTKDGAKITVPYTITDNDNNFDPDTVSVLIQNNTDNSILYYSPLSGTYSTNGTGTFTLPNTLSLDDWGTGYTVSILAEDVNGQYETDYASAPVVLSEPSDPVTYTKHEAVPPTCTTNGTIEYWEGSDGNNYTYDGSTYTQIESIVDPATGIHAYNSASPVWTWIKTNEGYDVSVKFKCSNCKAVEILESQPTVVYDAENGIYTASVTFEDHEYTDTQAETKCNITINGTEKQYTYGQKIKAVVSAPVEGQCFDGWYEGDTKLSGSETYYFYATRDINIHAVYAESVSESAPFYNYNVSPRQKLANGKQKVAFTVDWEFPEGYTLIEAGLVRSYTNINPISGGEDVTVKTSSLKGIRGTYVYNLTLGTANAEKTIYSKGYIKYRDSGNNEHTEYTELNTSSKA